MKISIATRDGFRAVESHGTFEVSGYIFAVTPDLKRAGRWRGTYVGTGLAVPGSWPSITGCIREVSRVVASNLPAFLSAIAGLPVAPPPGDLAAAVLPVPSRAVDIEPVVAAIVETLGGCTPDEVSGIRSALSSKTGRLKAKAPAEVWGKAAWNGLQPNAWKIQFSACFLPFGPAAFLTRLSRITWPAALDKDLAALRSLGVA